MAANQTASSKAFAPLATFALKISLITAVAFTCALILAVWSPATALAEDDDSETVRVGYYENEVFQEGAQEDTVKTGYAYEYYRKLSEYTGWRYDYVYGSYADLYQMLLDGKIDMLAGLAWRDDRAGLIGYPDAPMGNETFSLVKHASDTQTNADPATFNGKKIGVLDSAMVEVLNQYLSEQQVTADVVTFGDYEALFDAFDAGELDILAAEGDGAYGRDDTEVLCAFGASDYYLCVNVGRPDLLAELNDAQALLAAEEPNYINSLRSKYYGFSVTARAFSAAEREWIAEHDSLHVGYLENYLPYSDTDNSGEVTGFVKDIVPDILKSLGLSNIDVSYTGFTSYDDMIAAMDAGDIDVAFPVGGGLYYSEENGIYQSAAVASAPTDLVYKGEFTDGTTSCFAVNEKNRMQYYYIRTNYPDADILFCSSIDECLQAVISGKATCTTLNGLRSHDILKNRKYADLSLRETNRNDDRCFGVKIGNEGLLKLLNRGISVLGSDYALNLSYRYVDGLYAYSLLDIILDNMAIISTLLIIIAALIVFLVVRDSKRTKREMKEKEAARLQLEAKNCELAESKEALAEALNEAENANRAKTTFLNNMSHDIRTPMNAIVGFTTLASSHIDDKDQVEDYLGKISVSSRHLLSLINDVLDMSRIESGKMTIDEADMRLSDVIDDLRTIIQPMADEKQMQFSIDMHDVEHEDIVTDKLRLSQVLLNILSNAVKFTPDDGVVSFDVTEKPSDDEAVANFEFRVKDTGIGMSEEFQETLFDAFTREKTSTISGIQGTGLGMAITKSIVDMMGGTIEVNSAEGEGSEFIVNLPLKIGENSQEADQAPARDFSGKRVLLAEDNEMNQAIAVMILQESGFEVEVAIDGVQAVQMMEEAPAGHYDVVLMDIQMPNMDGYEACRQIRDLEDPAKANVPIVAVTANAFAEDVNTALESGMDGHLAKPYDIPAMMGTLDRLIP